MIHKTLIIFTSLYLLGCVNDKILNNSLVADTNSSAVFIAPAEVVSLQEINVGPPNIKGMWQFKIKFIAKENSFVKEGDLLLSFDGHSLEEEIVILKNELATIKEENSKLILEIEALRQELVLNIAERAKDYRIAKSKAEIFDISRSKVEHLKSLAEFKIMSTQLRHAREKLERHESRAVVALEVAKSNLDLAEFKLKEKEISLSKLDVFAPADGIVSLTLDWENKKATIGEVVWLGRTIINLPSLEKLSVKMEIQETHYSRLAIDREVKVILDDYKERSFIGQIDRIGKSFRKKSLKNPKVVIDAWVKLKEPDAAIIRPGMKANVEFL